MPSKTWTLVDVSEDIYASPMEITGQVLGASTTVPTDDLSVTWRTLRGGLREGVEVVELKTPRVEATILATRGMGIWKATIDGVELAWQSPVTGGPVHPSFVPLERPDGIGWLEGFDELMVRCGLEGNGPPEFDDAGHLSRGLHGRIANLPVRKLIVLFDQETGRIDVVGQVDESRLFGPKLRLTSTVSVMPDEPRLTIRDRVENLSAEEGELQLLYHTNFGRPLAMPGSKLIAPALRVMPRDDVALGNLPNWSSYGPETPGAPEAAFFIDMAADDDGVTEVLLQNDQADRGVSLRYNIEELPAFTLWKNRQGAADGYVTGLEPGLNFPNPKPFERHCGRVAMLLPEETREAELSLGVCADAESVAEATRRVEAILGDQETELSDAPDPTRTPFSW